MKMRNVMAGLAAIAVLALAACHDRPRHSVLPSVVPCADEDRKGNGCPDPCDGPKDRATCHEDGD